MKKALLALTLLINLVLISFVLPLSAETVKPTSMIIHYYRYAADYDTGWNAWLWPVGGEGAGYQFDVESDDIVLDSWGAVMTVDLTTNFATASRIGIILRQGEWVKKDVDKDRFIDVPAAAEGGVFHVYLVEGDERIGYSETDPDGPDKSDKVINAFFINQTQISFKLTIAVAASSVKLEVNGVETSATVSLNQNNGTVSGFGSVNLNNTYTLNVTFPSGVKTYDVTFEGIYDSAAFEDAYGYEGDDLGAVWSATKTTFKLWAPISSSVTLNLYNSGTLAQWVAKDPTATDTPYQTVTMTKGDFGVWSAEVAGDLHGKYYTYTVQNGIRSNEVVDPYAKSVGVNGLRGMVVDFARTNPEGFEYGDLPDTIETYTDSIIYEVHVRDLTSHSSWQVDSAFESYRGRFMGFTVRGTTYQGVSTGIDHIIELGVTHVQILPFFDYGSAVDETGSSTQFNWGYMPLNFNALEGHYSSNPYDGSVRINEFKQLVKTLTDNDLRVVMDVVYNHTGQSGDSNFHLILPGYYHRMNQDGSFSNGSGTGNETASERTMMQKFMIDSVKFWAEEYNIAGFRFDLMALHDTETMNLLTEALHEIDPTILVFGEPWTGGTTPLSSSIMADKRNLDDMPGVAAFNDEIRNAVRGGVFSAAERGFVQNLWNESIVHRMMYGIVGGSEFPGIDPAYLSYETFWGTNPNQTINYVSAHDNNTLYDKLRLSTTFQQRPFIPEMQKQANAIVLLAQGIPFIHAGAEILRSKPNVNNIGYNHNSYDAPDSVNQIRWDQKALETNLSVYEYYKDVIAFRKAHPAFRMELASEVNESLEFVDFNTDSAVGFLLKNYANGDSFETILVIHNSGEFNVLTLPGTEEWTLVLNQSGDVESQARTYQGGATIPLMENETVVLRAGVVVVPVEPTESSLGLILGIVGGSVLLLGGVVFFLIKKGILKF